MPGRAKDCRPVSALRDTLVEHLVGIKEKICPLKDDNGSVLTDVESMGELLNW